MHSTSGAWKEYSFQPAQRLLLRADLAGARERGFERGLDVLPAGDLTADVADQPSKPGAQDAQLPTVALNCLAWA